MFKEIPANKMSLGKRKLIQGIGYNDAPYQVRPTIKGKKVSCPFYSMWVDMLKRCYSPMHINARIGYKNCTVNPLWHKFMSFKQWAETQNWVGNVLDKDLRILGNTEYGPNTCMFIPSYINNFFVDHAAAKGDYPIGVHKIKGKKTNSYMAQCTKRGKTNAYIGYFSTPAAAHKAFIKRKLELLQEIIKKCSDIQLISALQTIYLEIQSGAFYNS